jgi:predicted RNA-binding protein with PIN domain
MTLPPPMTTWIVDAMNVIGSRPTGWWRDRSAAVSRLLDATRRLVAATREPVTLVVDGRPPPDVAEGEADGVRVIYAMHAGRNAADDRIVELVASDPEPAALRVVTSDRVLQERVRALGAQVVSPREWLRRVDSTGPVP